MRQIAADIISEDGIPEAAINEAADRLTELHTELAALKATLPQSADGECLGIPTAKEPTTMAGSNYSDECGRPILYECEVPMEWAPTRAQYDDDIDMEPPPVRVRLAKIVSGKYAGVIVQSTTHCKFRDGKGDIPADGFTWRCNADERWLARCLFADLEQAKAENVTLKKERDWALQEEQVVSEFNRSLKDENAKLKAELSAIKAIKTSGAAMDEGQNGRVYIELCPAGCKVSDPLGSYLEANGIIKVTGEPADKEGGA
jgi:hypothetical protein